MSERREATRRRVYLGGRVVHRHIRSDTRCLLRSLSASGARIVVAAATPLPDRFDVVIDRCGSTHPAETIWRSGDEMGLRFVTAAPDNDEVAALRACLAQNRTELDRLRARIAEIELSARPAELALH